eukprot:177555-Chlamydomonas_euryale.AAC.2
MPLRASEKITTSRDWKQRRRASAPAQFPQGKAAARQGAGGGGGCGLELTGSSGAMLGHNRELLPFFRRDGTRMGNGGLLVKRARHAARWPAGRPCSVDQGARLPGMVAAAAGALGPGMGADAGPSSRATDRGQTVEQLGRGGRDHQLVHQPTAVPVGW